MKSDYDVAIIGGSYAGLSAAMALGRARRSVIVIDSGLPCNRQTPHSHNFLTHDGSKPAHIASLGKAQVLEYPTIEWLEDLALNIEKVDEFFEIATNSGKIIKCKKVLFATGIKDLQPAIPGFAECWGISVIHCPYCHGYEYLNQSTGILANGDTAFEMARLIRQWTKQLVLFTNGPLMMSAANREQLGFLAVPVVEKLIKEIKHQQGHIKELIFDDDSSSALTALYAKLPFKQHSELPLKLGCLLSETGHLKTDDFQKTNIPGVFAAGDNTNLLRSLSMAVAAGGKAGAFINHELITEGVYSQDAL